MQRWPRIAGIGVVIGLLVLGVNAASAGPLPNPGPSPSDVGAAAAPSFQPEFESVYVPITPCRIVDTRSGTGAGATPISNLQIRSYYVGGTFGFAPQGGKSGGCGIPNGAVAISATLTAVAPSHGGFLRAWPNGQTEPGATVLNYGSTSTGTGATVTINPTTNFALRVRNYGGPTELVIDVSGYYAKPLAGFISPSGAPYAGSSRIVAATRITDPGVYEVTFDRDIRYCASVADPYYYNYYASTDSYGAASNNTLRVRLWNAAGAAVNGYFSVIVSC